MKLTLRIEKLSEYQILLINKVFQQLLWQQYSNAKKWAQINS